MASFVFVLLLPLGFIISYLNTHSWDIAEQELQEKHLLIAKGLEKPEIKPLMNSLVNTLDNVSSVSYTSLITGKTSISINENYSVRGSNNLKPFNYHLVENKYRKYDVNNSISNVIRSTVSRKPVVVMSHHIIGLDKNKRGTLFID